ncbi:MAG: RICIN domain-containing protein, partial [Thermoanaerobaculaceae bacterium]|nr:RICIN domain-containing protein [Thermoanaerobaculaceae bacterium]
MTAGTRIASFRLQTANNVGLDNVCRLDVVNTTTNATLATRTLRRSDFANQGSMVDIDLPFTLTADTSVEVRVNWYGNTQLGVQRVVIDARRADYVGPVTVYDGVWGEWKGIQLCPDDGFVQGYRMRVEANGSSGDNTALNGIELDCLSTLGVHSTIGFQGLWGTWGAWASCPTGKLAVGGQEKFEDNRGSSNDSAANSLKLRCQDGTEIEPPNGADRGTWKTWGVCPTGQAVCGMEVRSEDNQGEGGDDTALNGVRLQCCTAPGFIDDFVYQLKPSHATSMCVELTTSPALAGSNIDVSACTANNASQLFRAVAKDSGWFELHNVQSGKCVEIGGASKDPGGNVMQWNCGLGQHQEWQAVS